MQQSYSSCDTEDQEIFLKYLRVQTADELQKPKAQAQIEIKVGHPARTSAASWADFFRSCTQ